MCEKLIFHLLVLTYINFSVQQEVVVKLPNGQILGTHQTTSEDNSYYSFVGIPYGAPPVGKLRFKAPQPAKTWEGIFNATSSDIICYQLPPLDEIPVQGTPSEDCLRINVFTPSLPNRENKELLPVMVYIYGGAFKGGSSLRYGPDLFIDYDVVLVSLNYRTGVFGFISTLDEVIPGNAGLKDQALALQWVHDNIAFFRGDPTKVTIFGHSSGGGSCAYQLLNQNNLGLITGAILQSGTFLSPGMFQRNPRPNAFGTAAILNSTFETSDDSEALLEFLLTLEADALNEAGIKYVFSITKSWDDFIEPGNQFAPVIEAKNPEGFLTEKQYGLLKAGNILPVPTMLGFTSEEQIVLFQDQNCFKEVLTIIDEHLEYIVPDDTQITGLESRRKLALRIRDIYTDGGSFSDNLGGAIRYSSDNFLVRSTIKHAELFSSIAPTYVYQFSFYGQLDQVDVQYEGAGNVGHGAELPYIFCKDAACVDSSTAEADLVTRHRLLTLWTNFAKYQNPTPTPSEILQNVTWPQVSSEDTNLLYLDINHNLEVKTNPKQSYPKWVELYDSLGFDDFDTY